MKILLLGATGAMGVPLSAILCRQGYEVYVTSRRQEGEKSGIYFVKGNAHSIEFIKTLLVNKWDAIVDFMDYSTSEFEERYELFLQNTNHYLFLSSARVYANACDSIKEDSPRLLDVTQDKEYQISDEYAIHKAKEENLLVSSAYKNFTIIRPYITYSDERLQLGTLEKEGWAYRLFKNRTVVFSSDIAEHYTTLTYAGDVAYCISRLIGNVSAFGECFHITCGFPILWSDVLKIYSDTYRKETGHPFKVKLIDSGLNMSCETNRHQVIYDRLYDRRFDNSKILSIVGNYEFRDPRVGLVECFKSLIKNKTFRYVSIRDEEYKNRITGENLHITEIPGKKNKIKYLVNRLFNGKYALFK